MGSSSRNMACPGLSVRNLASFNRWASPPDRVLSGCPKERYPRPSLCRGVRAVGIFGRSPKNSAASSTVISRTSAMDFPLCRTSRISPRNRRPRQSGQLISTSERNCISTRMNPSPLQDSQRPPCTLKEKSRAFHPDFLASGAAAKIFRIVSQALVYVAALALGVLPTAL